MNIEMNLKESIFYYTKELKLPGIRKLYSEEADLAGRNGSGYEEYLSSLLEKELSMRIERRKQGRIKQADFPYRKYLQDLEIAELPPDGALKLKHLKSLNFMENGQNVILAGNAGTGKSHIAIGLGIKACLEDYKVLFTSVPSFVTGLKESRSARNLRQAQNKFEKYDLIILDELGYISFDKEGAELFFTALSLRAGRKSTIITTNLSFDRWNEIFHDPVITAAMVDRLTHKAILVDMTGPSYRMKETKKLLKTSTKI